MKLRGFLLLLCVFGAVEAQVDPGIASRRLSSFHLLSLSQTADVAVKNWLTRHKDQEEDIAARRYIIGDVDGDGVNDLLLVTSLTSAGGNYWSHDFVLIRARSPDQPIIAPFGGKGVRSYESISMTSSGILVNALYYGESDADCCPTVKKKVLFELRKDALIERIEK